MLAGTLKGVISQRLVPTADGSGRVAACEVLRMTGRVRDMIMDPTQTGRLPRGHRRGRVLRDADLRPGAVRAPQGRPHHDGGGASQAATSPHDFKLLVAADGSRGTTMDDLFDAESRRAAVAV